MTPNALLLEDKEEVQKIFAAVGLKVNYKKNRGLLQEEIFLYGMRSK